MPKDITKEGAGDTAVASGKRKAAAFLLSLDSESAALVMQQLSEREVGELSREMAAIGELTPAELDASLEEFGSRSAAGGIAVGARVQALLERALGRDKGRELLDRARRASAVTTPFKALGRLDIKQLQGLLRDEHPQVQALVIAHLDAPLASNLLKGMDEEMRFEVVKRMSSSEDLPPELVNQIDEMLGDRAAGMGVSKSEAEAKGRFKTVAQMLTLSEPQITKSLLERLGKEVPAAANEIQSLMFVFEDLLKISDRDMQKVMSEVDKGDLSLALKAAPPEIASKLLGALSARARDSLKEEIEMLGPRPLKEVEEAQKRILQQVRGMEERGDIKVNRGVGGGEVMV